MELSRQSQQQFSDYLAKKQGDAQAPSRLSGSEMELEETPSSSSAGSHRPIKTEISIQLLTTGYWPTFPAYPTLVMPSELQALMRQFQHFYDHHFQGRRLTWAHALERCIVIGWFPKKKHELEVSLLQAVVLKCFNQSDRISFHEIK